MRGWPFIAVLLLLAPGCTQPQVPAASPGSTDLATSGVPALPGPDPCDAGNAPPTLALPLHGNESETARAAFAALGLTSNLVPHGDGWFRTYRANDTIASFQDNYRWHPRLYNLDRKPLAVDGGLDGFFGRFGLVGLHEPKVERWQTPDGSADSNDGVALRDAGVLFHQQVAGRAIESSRGTFNVEGTDLILGKTYAVPAVTPPPDHELLTRAASYVRCHLDRAGETEAEGFRISGVHSGETDVVDGRLVQRVGFSWAGAYPCEGRATILLWQDLGTGDLFIEDEVNDCFRGAPA